MVMTADRIYNNLLLKAIDGASIPEECFESMDAALANEMLNRFDIQAWWFEKIRPFENGMLRGYVEQEVIHTDVEVDKIVGTEHCRYKDRTWIDMMCNLKRPEPEKVDIGKLMECLSDSTINPICLYKLEDEYYIYGDGNHRVCQAKFCEISHVHAKVQVFRKKEDDAKMHKTLEQSNITSRGLRKLIGLIRKHLASVVSKHPFKCTL